MLECFDLSTFCIHVKKLFKKRPALLMSLHSPLALIVPGISRLTNLFYINKPPFLKHPLSFCLFGKTENVFFLRQNGSKVTYLIHLLFFNRMTRLKDININWTRLATEFSRNHVDSCIHLLGSSREVFVLFKPSVNHSKAAQTILLMVSDGAVQHCVKLNFTIQKKRKPLYLRLWLVKIKNS